MTGIIKAGTAAKTIIIVFQLSSFSHAISAISVSRKTVWGISVYQYRTGGNYFCSNVDFRLNSKILSLPGTFKEDWFSFYLLMLFGYFPNLTLANEL